MVYYGRTNLWITCNNWRCQIFYIRKQCIHIWCMPWETFVCDIVSLELTGFSIIVGVLCTMSLWCYFITNASHLVWFLEAVSSEASPTWCFSQCVCMDNIFDTNGMYVDLFHGGNGGRVGWKKTCVFLGNFCTYDHIHILTRIVWYTIIHANRQWFSSKHCWFQFFILCVIHNELSFLYCILNIIGISHFFINGVSFSEIYN